MDHSNTPYSSTLEVSKKSNFLDANCLSDALAFQKRKFAAYAAIFFDNRASRGFN